MAAEYGRLGFCTIVHSSLQCTNVLQCWIWQNGDSLNASVHRSLQCTSVHTTQNMAAEYARLRILCNCTLQRHHQAEKYFKIHKNTRLTYQLPMYGKQQPMNTPKTALVQRRSPLRNLPGWVGPTCSWKPPLCPFSSPDVGEVSTRETLMGKESTYFLIQIISNPPDI